MKTILILASLIAASGCALTALATADDHSRPARAAGAFIGTYAAAGLLAIAARDYSPRRSVRVRRRRCSATPTTTSDHAAAMQPAGTWTCHPSNA